MEPGAGARSGEDKFVQRRERSHGKGNSRLILEADHKIDARSKTGTAPDETTDMRRTHGLEIVDRRLRLRSYRCTTIGQSPLAVFVRGRVMSLSSLTWDIRG
jgi:hypothetical protein